jgi:hypothetical protein
MSLTENKDSSSASGGAESSPSSGIHDVQPGVQTEWAERTVLGKKCVGSTKGCEGYKTNQYVIDYRKKVFRFGGGVPKGTDLGEMMQLAMKKFEEGPPKGDDGGTKAAPVSGYLKSV